MEDVILGGLAAGWVGAGAACDFGCAPDDESEVEDGGVSDIVAKRTSPRVAGVSAAVAAGSTPAARIINAAATPLPVFRAFPADCRMTALLRSRAVGGELLRRHHPRHGGGKSSPRRRVIHNPAAGGLIGRGRVGSDNG